MRQFDVIVWDYPQNDDSKNIEPPFTDRDLGWFFGNDLNKSLDESDAEWLVFAHSSVNIDRNFLNDLAQAISGFPMVDAFAPKVNLNNGQFASGYVIHKRNGLQEIPQDEPLRFVAAPTPYVAAFSRRIVQRTGHLDMDRTPLFAIMDLAFRMLHAGGKMFSVPYLVASLKASLVSDDVQKISTELDPLRKDCAKELGVTLFKTFGFFGSFGYLMTHLGALHKLYRDRKALNQKRESAILLSKFKPGYRKQITA